MFETVSVFDAMEMDHTQQRVASRRALALAHNRVERNLGSFLRGAHSEQEFEERLALLQDEFAGYVTTASQEVGHEHPEHIAKALQDHYRLAMPYSKGIGGKAVEFEETPAEKQEEEEEQKEAHVRWSNIKVLAGPVNPMLDQFNPLQQQQQQQQQQGGPPGMPGAPGAPQQGMPGMPGQMPGMPGQVPGAPNALEQQPQGGQMPPGAPGAPRRASEGKQGSPLADGHNPYEHFLGPDPNDLPGENFYNQHGQPDADPMRNQQGYMRPGIPKGVGDIDEGFEQIPYEVNPDPRMQRQHGYGQDVGLEIAPNLPPLEVPPGAPIHRGHKVAYEPLGQRPSLSQDPWGNAEGGLQVCPQCGTEGFNGQFCSHCGFAPNSVAPPGMGMTDHMAASPAEQKDTSPDTVTCPECGGDGKTAGATKCAKCNGKGKVRNFGDSATDFYGADIKTSAEDQNNTGLDGPEPKMDKGQGPGSMPDVPGDIVEKDVVEPIKATNEDALSDIGDIKTESLPSETENAGFQTGGEDSGPHTKTFGDGGQANPVTHETLSSHNPLSDILTSEFPPDQVVNEALLSLHE